MISDKAPPFPSTVMRVPTTALLCCFASLRQGGSWPALQQLREELRRSGYRGEACAIEDGLDAAEWPGQREMVLSQLNADGEEVGIVYLGFDSEGLLQSASLSWIVGQATTVEAFEHNAEQLMRSVDDVLGSPSGMLFDAPEGLAPTGDADVVMAQAFWPHSHSPGVETSVHRGHQGSRQFRAALKAHPDAATLWLVADAWQDGAALQAVFRPFITP